MTISLFLDFHELCGAVLYVFIDQAYDIWCNLTALLKLEIAFL
jgi:hypothetical protein